MNAQAALLVTIRSFSGSSLFPAGAAREPPGDENSAAQSAAFTLPTLWVLRAGKDIYPPAGHSPSGSRNQNPGAAGRKKKKSRRRPPLPQVQVGSLRFRPPGDEIGPGHIGGASLRVSDWRRAVLRCLRIRLLGETVEKTGGQETEALGGLR